MSLQSHAEVLKTLDEHPSLRPSWLPCPRLNGASNGAHVANNGVAPAEKKGKLFVASISPQARASIAATYGVTEREAGRMIEQLLSGPQGLRSGGLYGTGFTWVLDTNVVREAALVMAAEEVSKSLAQDSSKSSPGQSSIIANRPILTSACPGWVCYVEKTHPYVLPHLSRLKSPQAIAGTLIKSTLSRRYNVAPGDVWHVAIMPCFDKKLEASRAELTDEAWHLSPSEDKPVRDVDCVITPRELIMLAESRGIDFSTLPHSPLPSSHRVPFPDPTLDTFLFPRSRRRFRNGPVAGGSSGGYLWHIMQTYRNANPGSELRIERGRNVDVVDYTLVRDDQIILRTARYYGFRNIQNLVRRLTPAKRSRMPGAASRVAKRSAGETGSGGSGDYAYVEVMACPGGCTNGGGQIKVADLPALTGAQIPEIKSGAKAGPTEQREWLVKVDEAYFSAASDPEDDISSSDESAEISQRDQSLDDADSQGFGQDVIDGIPRRYINEVLQHWADLTGIELQTLLFTSFREVESDVGKMAKGDMERVASLASSIGGGW